MSPDGTKHIASFLPLYSSRKKMILTWIDIQGRPSTKWLEEKNRLTMDDRCHPSRLNPVLFP
jgi:hypothetical protein